MQEYDVVAADLWSLPQWANDVGSIASTISLIVSIYIVCKIWRISKHYRQLALIPKIKTRVRTNLKNMNTQIQKKDWQAFRLEVANATAVALQAKSITFGVSRKSAKKAVSAAKSITKISATSFQDATAEQLVLALTEMETHLIHFIENKKWQ